MYLLTKPTQSSKLLIKLAFQRLLGYHITQKIHLVDKAEDCGESVTTAQGREVEVSSEATRCFRKLRNHSRDKKEKLMTE